MEKPENNEEQLEKDRYRFGGYKYGFRGTDHWGPDDYIPQIKSLYAFPKSDTDSRNLLNQNDREEK